MFEKEIAVAIKTSKVYHLSIWYIVFWNLLSLVNSSSSQIYKCLKFWHLIILFWVQWFSKYFRCSFLRVNSWRAGGHGFCSCKLWILIKAKSFKLHLLLMLIKNTLHFNTWDIPRTGEKTARANPYCWALWITVSLNYLLVIKWIKCN